MSGRDGCRDFESLLGASVDGALSPAETTRLDAHLAGCESCRREVEAATAIAGELRSLEAEELPPFFTSRLLAMLDEPRGELQPAHRSSPLRSLRFAWGSAAALAIALIGTLVGYHAGWTPIRPHESSSPSLSQAPAPEKSDVAMSFCEPRS